MKQGNDSKCRGRTGLQRICRVEEAMKNGLIEKDGGVLLFDKVAIDLLGWRMLVVFLCFVWWCEVGKRRAIFTLGKKTRGWGRIMFLFHKRHLFKYIYI